VQFRDAVRAAREAGASYGLIGKMVGLIRTGLATGTLEKEGSARGQGFTACTEVGLVGGLASTRTLCGAPSPKDLWQQTVSVRQAAILFPHAGEIRDEPNSERLIGLASIGWGCSVVVCRSTSAVRASTGEAGQIGECSWKDG
jgi:hypothetical protein